MTFTKEQLQHIIETDHVQCGDASALARMALAGIEAEPVAWAHRLINKRNGVVHSWVYGSAEACPSEGDIFNIEVMPLYTAPPAPVSVPDERYQHLSELYHAQEKRLFKLAQRIKGASFDKYAYSPSQAIDVLESAIFGEREDECRAAMLQSFGNSEQLNSPVIPDGWVACSEQMPEENAEQEVLACFKGGDISTLYYFEGRWDDAYGIVPIRQDVTHWMPLPSAPQQEA